MIKKRLEFKRAGRPKISGAQAVGSAEFEAMLGVVMYADHPSHVFTAKSSEQFRELNKAVPFAWHMPHATTAIICVPSGRDTKE